VSEQAQLKFPIREGIPSLVKEAAMPWNKDNDVLDKHLGTRN
jgi:uncharacterized protein YbaR (Trm112 family)